jgi:hypothetical protein
MNVIHAQDAPTCVAEVGANHLQAERLVDPLEERMNREAHPVREQRRREIEADLLRALTGGC